MVPESYQDKHLNGGVQKHVETAKNGFFFHNAYFVTLFWYAYLITHVNFSVRGFKNKNVLFSLKDKFKQILEWKPVNVIIDNCIIWLVGSNSTRLAKPRSNHSLRVIYLSLSFNIWLAPKT